MPRLRGRPGGDEPGGREADEQAEERRQRRLPDRAPEDGDVGPFDLRRLVAEQAAGEEELVIGGQGEVPFDAAAELLGQEGIDHHQQDRQQQEDADEHPCRQQQRPDDAG